MFFNVRMNRKMKNFPACLAVLPEQDEFHLGGGALDDGRGVLVAPPIKDLVVNLTDRQTDRQADILLMNFTSRKTHSDASC